MIAAVVLLAHMLPVPRVDTVSVTRDGAVVTIEHAVDATRAAEIRAIYDRDRDGVLDEKERALLETWLRLSATRPVALELDGARVALAEESATFEIPARGELHATIVLRAKWTLDAGPHRIALRDPGAAASVGFGARARPAPGAVSRASLTRDEPVLAVAFEAF